MTDEAQTPQRAARPAGLPAQPTFWILVSTAVTGISTYVLLVATARAVGPESYGNFGVFWAVIVIVGLGLFLPMEQETTRRGAGLAATGGFLGALWRRATQVAGIAAGGAILAMSVLWWWLSSVVDDQLLILLAFGAAVIGYSLQFPARGVLAATRQFRGYAMVVMSESVLRAVVAVVLWVSGGTSVGLYAAAVGGASVIAGLTGVWRVRRDGSSVGTGKVQYFGRDSARLVIASSSMQTLLNSGTLVAKLMAPPSQAALAGQFLAVMTIARLPVLFFQSLQAAYVSQLSARWHKRDVRGVRQLLAVLGLLAGVLAVVLVAGAAIAGPWVTTLLFGADYVIDNASCLLIALGVAVYLVAAVASDSSVAVGMHTLIVTAWLAGLLAGTVVILTTTSLLVKATMPLVAGAGCAGVVLIVALVVRTRGRA